MRLDYEKYRPMLAERNLSREDEDEILEYLWNLMGSQVDRAFEMHPVQLAHKDKDNVLQSPDLIVCNKRKSLRKIFTELEN